MYNQEFAFQSMHIAMTYDNIGDKKKASEWFSHGLNLSPEVFSSELARGSIFEYRGEYNKAFDTYLKTEGPSWVNQIARFRLMELGLQTKRHSEVITHFQKVLPTLFQPDVRIDKNNFTDALAVGRLLKADGEREQADLLLKGSLKIARLEMFEVPLGTRNNNWECRVHLAMGNEDAALVSFIKFVEEGYHSDQIVRDPVYAPLYGKPEFRRSLEIMKTRLEEERAIVKQMEARGELDIPPLPDN
jgi:tetratricopeptide (TPR) repeat protein